jgi:hydrogenase maturation protease
MIRIIGIGSPFGDDAAGLEAARQLAAAPPPHTEVLAADRPGTTLIDLFDSVDAVILIDAAHSDAPAGRIHDIDLHALRLHPVALVSSHDLGVVEVVQLAATLGRLPPHGRVLGIEIGAAGFGARVDGCVGVQVGIAEAVNRAQRWCAAYRRIIRSTQR